MIITPNAYVKLLNQFPSFPPESGAILGGFNGMVKSCVFDKGVSSTAGSYTPDVRCIEETFRIWQTEKLCFLGIAHSHNGDSLSSGDRQYIETIMRAMPEWVVKLYFPIVKPRKYIVSYSAKKTAHQILISENPIIIRI